MYFHTDSMQTIDWLYSVLGTASRNERSVRFDVDSEGNLKVKVGEGAWTAPIASTPDQYRDLSQVPDFSELELPEAEPDTDDGMTCEHCTGIHGMHYLDCDAFAWL